MSALMIDQVVFNIDDVEIENKKIIWRCLLNYINGEFNYSSINMFDVKNAIIDLIGDDILSSFINITHSSVIIITVTGIQQYSDEFILEALVQHNNEYSMCFGCLYPYNLDYDINFEHWYNNNNTLDNNLFINNMIDNNVHAIIIDDDYSSNASTATSSEEYVYFNDLSDNE